MLNQFSKEKSRKSLTASSEADKDFFAFSDNMNVASLLVKRSSLKMVGKLRLNALHKLVIKFC